MLARFSQLLLLLACLPLHSNAMAGDEKQHANDVVGMSFNMRYGTAQAGENHWDLRKEFLTETIRGHGLDLLGVGRDDGWDAGY